MTEGQIKQPFILVLEDDPDFRTILVKTLRSAGYDVAEAESVRKALDIARDRVPDLVFTDIQVTGTEGLNFVRIIRGTVEAPLRDVPIIALSGLERSVWRARALSAGCNEFIEKPISPEELIQVVRRHASQGQ